MLQKASRFWVIGAIALASSAGAVAACGPSTTPAPRLPEPPEARTQAALVGPLCASGQSCACRDITSPDDAMSPGAPIGPAKRFEVRVGPHSNDLWVTVAGNVLYKSKERATECFYLDLTPGKHPVVIRGRGEYGLAAHVTISEMSAGGPWWYPTLDFDCAPAGLCDAEGFAAWKAGLADFAPNLHAPCGSTKIRGIEWQAGRMPDGQHPSDIELRLVLDVYEFETKEAPGQCKRARRKAAATRAEPNSESEPESEAGPEIDAEPEPGQE